MQQNKVFCTKGLSFASPHGDNTLPIGMAFIEITAY